MVEAQTITPLHFTFDSQSSRDTFDKRFHRISDNSCNPMMEAMETQLYSSDRAHLISRAQAIAKLHGKKSSSAQTTEMSFMRTKISQKSILRERGTNAFSSKITQTYYGTLMP